MGVYEKTDFYSIAGGWLRQISQQELKNFDTFTYSSQEHINFDNFTEETYCSPQGNIFTENLVIFTLFLRTSSNLLFQFF